jgi:hypothetical protein
MAVAMGGAMVGVCTAEDVQPETIRLTSSRMVRKRGVRFILISFEYPAPREPG